ncbi:MAG TPA: hypothetical protein VHL31_23940 [Geminicoccus sp.]|uniref:hypothetical protein n=1 Tax=Geminicoccus sp. TaxID=2024832 RepID=UPI002E3226BE|nr:hypothetical protein [Geminicoccus sp.]HEX2529331.1 hypothetical protein [Geminicoccus sp.]
MRPEFVRAPKLAAFLAMHPGVRAEVIAAKGFVDVVPGGFDTGMRCEESLGQDMIAVPLGSSRRSSTGPPAAGSSFGRSSETATSSS